MAPARALATHSGRTVPRDVLERQVKVKCIGSLIDPGSCGKVEKTQKDVPKDSPTESGGRFDLGLAGRILSPPNTRSDAAPRALRVRGGFEGGRNSSHRARPLASLPRSRTSTTFAPDLGRATIDLIRNAILRTTDPSRTPPRAPPSPRAPPARPPPGPGVLDRTRDARDLRADVLEQGLHLTSKQGRRDGRHRSRAVN